MSGFHREGRRAHLPPLMHDGHGPGHFPEPRLAFWGILLDRAERTRFDPPRRPRRETLLPERSQE